MLRWWAATFFRRIRTIPRARNTPLTTISAVLRGGNHRASVSRMSRKSNPAPDEAIVSSRDSLAVEVVDLVKRYDGRPAVDGITFEVRPGEVFAILGPNGAGKTTTVEILEGYRSPDAGEVRVMGLDPLADAGRLKPSIGVMLQRAGIYPQIHALEAIRHFAGLYSNPRDPVQLLQMVGLENAAGVRFRHLSGGQQQRLSLALALVGQPKLLFLDEPTTGMDPQARRATWEMLRAQQALGVTIVLTTHFMDEAERLADRVAIIDHGRLLALGPPRELIGRALPRQIRFRTNRELRPEELNECPGDLELHQRRPGEYWIEAIPTPELVAELCCRLRDLDVLMTELDLGTGSLEETFLELTGRDMRPQS